ncbi:MAG: Sip1-related alpha-galactosidase, partial [Bacteroides sp.]|nr:Sip1-related alpha-galactosidase [Bacteroides sp.]
LPDESENEWPSQRFLRQGVRTNGWVLLDQVPLWYEIWRNMNGFMAGVSPEHTMNNLREHLAPVPGSGSDRLMPHITPESADAFYKEMTADTKDNGFDIIKVDFQSNNYSFNKGSENAILGVHYNNTALEENCAEKGLQLLNCIAQQNFNVFNHRYSSLIRGSVDYKTSTKSFDLTLVQNFTNAFWLGHTHWIDQDMFYANFEETALTMAVARAVSGGPVYLSDETSNIDASSLEALYYEDGRLLGTRAPAVPLPESLMRDPYFDGGAFRTIAPLENGSAVIFAVNLNHDEQAIEAGISENDYSYAGGMIQPYEGLWELPKEGILLYNQFEREATVLDDTYSFELVSRKGQIFQLSPIKDGWSVIGRPDKYLCASGFNLLEIDKKSIKIRMIEDGPLMLWAGSKIPASENFEFTELSKGLWQGELKNPNTEKVYTITAKPEKNHL